jgi:hypothetical protein
MRDVPRGDMLAGRGAMGWLIIKKEIRPKGL